jgi:hypothetical protein
MTDIEPPWTPISSVDAAVRSQGFSLVRGTDVLSILGASVESLDSFATHWDALPLDAHLRDGGRYRRRRHACFVLEGDALTEQPPRPHWQPLEYNALHGGFERWFEPLPDSLVAAEPWTRLLVWLGRRADALRGGQTWYVEAHAFRIDTTDGIGRPTPEGAHRDGVDLVAVMLVARDAVRGGETRVFEAESTRGSRFTLRAPWSLLLLDDARVVHETTPILPLLGGGDAYAGRRDTLVVTLRKGGFQSPGAVTG